MTLRELSREFVLDKRYEPPLRIAITDDVALRGLNRPVASEQIKLRRLTCSTFAAMQMSRPGSRARVQ